MARKESTCQRVFLWPLVTIGADTTYVSHSHTATPISHTLIHTLLQRCFSGDRPWNKFIFGYYCVTSVTPRTQSGQTGHGHEW